MELDIPAAQFLSSRVFSDFSDVLKICTDITGDEDGVLNSTARRKSRRSIPFLRKNSFEGVDILFVRAGSSARSVKAKTSEDHFAAEMLKETRNAQHRRRFAACGRRPFGYAEHRIYPARRPRLYLLHGDGRRGSFAELCEGNAPGERMAAAYRRQTRKLRLS